MAPQTTDMKFLLTLHTTRESSNKLALCMKLQAVQTSKDHDVKKKRMTQ
uniref:Uncharacterized protein n=1 Tax=Rhizophora mucronata TaxID=61149 RepID=A0A2P2MRI6_RHIMU